jgi:hypothetical protein
MPIYGYETPDGYKMTEAAWLSPDGLARRLSFATALSSGHLPLDPSDPAKAGPVSAAPVLSTLGGAISPDTNAAVDAAAPQLKTAVLLGSPDFMHR